VIRFTGYGVIAEKMRVGQLGRIFSLHPVEKNYALDRKMNNSFFGGLDEVYQRAKFGEHRTMRAGCRCENVVSVFCLFVRLRSRSAVR